MKKAPTIYDIARIANVSAATVSRALNDSPLIKTETKKLISKIADDLSYRPNLTARALITSKTDTLALFYHTTARLISEDPMFLNIMDGVNFESHTAGYTLLFSAVSENLEDSRVINSITSTAEKSDGVIIVTNNLRKNRSEMGLDLRPVVITGFDMPGETCVLNDDYGCMKGAIQYLYENGHKKVGFISQPISHQTVGERYRGFLDGIREYNLTPVDELVYVNEMTDGEINNLIKGMMSKGMDSLILSNLFVPAISNELKKLNVSIPNDISILVFNDFEDKPMIDAGYSVIQSRRFEMGRAAVRTLIQLINGEIESGTKQIIPTRLIEGRTVRKNREGYC